MGMKLAGLVNTLCFYKKLTLASAIQSAAVPFCLFSWKLWKYLHLASPERWSDVEILRFNQRLLETPSLTGSTCSSVSVQRRFLIISKTRRHSNWGFGAYPTSFSVVWSEVTFSYRGYFRFVSLWIPIRDCFLWTGQILDSLVLINVLSCFLSVLAKLEISQSRFHPSGAQCHLLQYWWRDHISPQPDAQSISVCRHNQKHKGRPLVPVSHASCKLPARRGGRCHWRILQLKCHFFRYRSPNPTRFGVCHFQGHSYSRNLSFGESIFYRAGVGSR